MFDFFKDMYLELNGIDSETINTKRKEKEEKRKKDKIIFSFSTKIIVFVFGILYLIMTGLNIAFLKDYGTLNTIVIIRFIFLTLCDIASLICISIKRKNTEIAALILILVFGITQYFTTVLM